MMFRGSPDLMNLLRLCSPLWNLAESKNHVRCSAKISSVLRPTHTTLAVPQSYELLAHHTATLWAPMLVLPLAT